MGGSADAKSVVGPFGLAFDQNSYFVANLSVIANVPSQSLKKRIDKFDAELRLVIIGALIGAFAASKLLDELVDAVGYGQKIAPYDAGHFTIETLVTHLRK